MNLKGEIKKYAAGSWKKRGLGYGRGWWERGKEVVVDRKGEISPVIQMDHNDTKS